MTIVKRKHKSCFAIIPNTIWADGRLTIESKGTLGYLLSRPHNWHVRLAQIGTTLNIGKDRLQRIFRELIAAGYVTREQERDKGTYGAMCYVVRDEGRQAAGEYDDQREGIATSSQLEKTVAVQPQPENQATYKERIYIKTESTKPLPQPLSRFAAADTGIAGVEDDDGDQVFRIAAKQSGCAFVFEGSKPWNAHVESRRRDGFGPPPVIVEMIDGKRRRGAYLQTFWPTAAQEDASRQRAPAATDHGSFLAKIQCGPTERTPSLARQCLTEPEISSPDEDEEVRR